MSADQIIPGVAQKAVVDYLKKQGLGGVHDLNRLSIAAVSASLADTGYIRDIHDKVAVERNKWIAVLDQLHLKYTDSQANFVYFDINKQGA